MELLITVVIPSYNMEKYIIECVDSVLNQTYMACLAEVIIVDDGSVDATASIVKRNYAHNPLVKYIYQQNGGLSDARNTGIKSSCGNYIAFLDADDMWESTMLEIYCSHIHKYPDVALFYSDFYNYEHETKNIRPIRVNAYRHNESNLLQKFVMRGGPIVPSTVVIKKDIFDKVGLFDTQLRMGGEDTDMWLRIAQKHTFQHIQNFTLKKRSLANSLGSDTVKNAIGYKIALDKLEKEVPSIAPYRQKRDALIEYKVGLYLYKIGDVKASAKHLKSALKKDPKLKKAYALLLSVNLKRYTGVDLFKIVKS